MMAVSLDPFQQYLKIERGVSVATITHYCQDIRLLLDHQDWARWTPDILARYLADRGYTISTRRRKWQAVRAYQRFLGESQWPAILPKAPRRLPRVMSQETARNFALTPAYTGNSAFYKTRNQLIITLLYGCGLRVSELCGLLRKSVCLDQTSITVTGKGNRTRVIPLNPWVIRALQAHQPPETASHVITTASGKPLSRQCVYQLVKLHAATQNSPASPHAIRHAFATHLVENGASLSAVQALLGHQSLDTTQLYTYVDTQRIQADYLAAWHAG